jgi:hypothetical protein
MASTPRILGLVAGLATTLAAVPPLAAEVVRFRAGGIVELPARDEGRTVVIDSPTGPIRFQRDEIQSIEPRPLPAEQWPARREAALRGGAEDRFAAAVWALDHALTDEALELFRAAHEADPSSERCGLVASTAEALQRPLPDPDARSLRFLGSDRFRETRGRLVLLRHQHDEEEARQRVALLDRVATSYYLAFAARGFALRVPTRKLVMAWIAEPADYRAILRAEGATAFLSTHGYYHPTRRIVFTLDVRRLEKYRRLSRPPHDRATLLLDLERRALDIGTAAHELVHLAVAESRLAPRHEDFPVWLHEGLAMQFEATRGGRWAGIGGVNPIRLAHWRGLPAEPPLLPLLRDAGLGQGYRASRYAAAWGLAYFAWNEKAAELAAFLDLLRTPAGPAEAGTARSVAAFRAAFGEDLDALQRDWHRSMRSLGADGLPGGSVHE